MTESEPAPDPVRVIGITVPTLFSGRVEEASALDNRVTETALTWQELGGEASFQEMSAVANRAEPGRVFTLFGRIASAGEQLGIAGTAYRDARAWVAQPSSDDRIGLPARALAEISGYYAISTGHGLVNVAARLLALETRSRAMLARSQPRSKGFPPFDERFDHWLAFNTSSVSSLEEAAEHHMEARQLAHLLRTLIDDERWAKLVDRRNVDFHRWRPQSVHGGVATSNPWTDHGDYQSLTVYDGETHQPDDHRALIAEVGAALEALEATMRAWNEIFPAAMHGVRTYVLAEAMSGIQLDRDRD
ncbi:hypothetical protein [Humibacter ginsenosidimutans]|uniref:Uncharacterized protein n=1 Tax=Humibacter ginsenosidimutans TaxID=2599293 RepID=A0A5B8M270_9MICO|nr:hypothetical protein [Humibacter ginsenosidimutans]QDZ14171.1 hypothetical protein FPZ11_04730 [Humibacter ginsenosidimutans]